MEEAYKHKHGVFITTEAQRYANCWSRHDVKPQRYAPYLRWPYATLIGTPQTQKEGAFTPMGDLTNWQGDKRGGKKRDWPFNFGALLGGDAL